MGTADERDGWALVTKQVFKQARIFIMLVKDILCFVPAN